MTNSMKHQVAGLPLRSADLRLWPTATLPIERQVHQRLVRFWSEDFEHEVMRPLCMQVRRDGGDDREWWRLDLTHMLRP